MEEVHIGRYKANEREKQHNQSMYETTRKQEMLNAISVVRRDTWQQWASKKMRTENRTCLFA